MPEAVIVSAARTPIGRAFKGSLKDVRPDDLAAQVVEPAPVPEPATLALWVVAGSAVALARVRGGRKAASA